MAFKLSLEGSEECEEMGNSVLEERSAKVEGPKVGPNLASSSVAGMKCSHGERLGPARPWRPW